MISDREYFERLAAALDTVGDKRLAKDMSYDSARRCYSW